MEQQWDVVVIGGGAAGLSAALMLGRARRRTLVVDGGEPRNRFAAHAHGVLGHDGVEPGVLLARGRDEVAAYGVEVVRGTVDRVAEEGAGLVVTVGDDTHGARAVIVATGMTDELPDIPGLAARWGRSVLHCPYCHGWEVRDQHLGVLATSPLSLHQIELVRQWSDRVTAFTASLGPLDDATARRLRARGIELVVSPVVEITGEGTSIDGVRTEEGHEVAVDALFTVSAPRPHDAFLAPLGMERTDGPMGSVLAVDPTGRTSHERVWAVGNVVNPTATVPVAISVGALAGGFVNMVLVTDEFDAAVAATTASSTDAAGGETSQPPGVYWEARYAGAERMWSGAPNRTLTDVAADLTPGRALDLGCGEGADAIWLAQRGWQVTGVDISATAVDRAAAAARASGVPPERVRFVAADLESWTAEAAHDGGYDLVTASFLHAPVALARTDVLRQAAGHVAPGGHLLVVGHAAAPPWADEHRHHAHRFLAPDEEIATLDLDASVWTTVRAETRRRAATGPNGEEVALEDTVVLLRRT